MQSMNAIDEDWRKKCSTGPIHRKPTLTDTGLMLGRETILARTAHGAIDAAGVSVDSDEARVLAVLAAAYRRPVANHAIAKMRRASELWHEGEKALAQFHLAFIDCNCSRPARVGQATLGIGRPWRVRRIASIARTDRRRAVSTTDLMSA